jgi:hypothetical protein
MEQIINEAIEKLENNEMNLSELFDLLTDIQLIIA